MRAHGVCTVKNAGSIQGQKGLAGQMRGQIYHSLKKKYYSSTLNLVQFYKFAQIFNTAVYFSTVLVYYSCTVSSHSASRPAVPSARRRRNFYGRWGGSRAHGRPRTSTTGVRWCGGGALAAALEPCPRAWACEPRAWRSRGRA